MCVACLGADADTGADADADADTDACKVNDSKALHRLLKMMLAVGENINIILRSIRSYFEV